MQLVLATSVAIVVVVAVVPALVVVVVVVCVQFVMRLVAQIGTAVFVQVVGILTVYATGLEVLVLLLGGTFLSLPLSSSQLALSRACAACVGHDDNNNSFHCLVKHTTHCSCTSWRDCISCTYIVLPAHGVACALLPLKPFQADGAASFHHCHKSRGLTGSTP